MTISRRTLLQSSLAAGMTLAASRLSADDTQRKKTEFQIACMTLPYSRHPLRRALTGIKEAGFEHVAWGTTHVEEGGDRVPVLSPEDSTAKAAELGKRCRDMGLIPVLMFSTVYPEHERGLEILTHRLKQAAAGGVPQVLTFGHTKGGNRKVWIERFKQLGPIARDLGVLLVVKQHGGETGTGEACAEIIREVDDAGVWVNYDAGNVMDYLNIDPLGDISKCAAEIRSFCIKDHRNWPKDQDCGPGLGEIDHYRLLNHVAFTGETMPLACENIFAPLVARPTDPAGIDSLARRSRNYLEYVIAGLHAQ